MTLSRSNRLFTVPYVAFLAFVAIAAVGGSFALAALNKPGSPVVDEEPEAAHRSSPEVEVGNGTTESGDSWSAISYVTKGGYLCLDFFVEGPSTDGHRVMSGSCFLQTAEESQQAVGGFGDLLATQFAHGRLPVPAGATAEARDVTIELADGGSVSTTSLPNGLYFVPVSEEPIKAVYYDEESQRREAPFKGTR